MMTRRKEIQTEYKLCGLCYSDGKLYTMEQGQGLNARTYTLAVYQVHNNSGDITLVDRLVLTDLWPRYLFSEKPLFVCLRVESHSQCVFLPIFGRGVLVAHLDGDRLARKKILTCTRVPRSVAVMSPNTVYACDNRRVHIVDVRSDRTVSYLEIPEGNLPDQVAVLGDTALVSYFDGPTVVVYRHGSLTPVRVISLPERLRYLPAITSDGQRYFLMTDNKTKSVFVVDDSGNLCYKVNIESESTPMNCVVVNRQLWVRCRNGDIVIMSSQ